MQSRVTARDHGRSNVIRTTQQMGKTGTQQNRYVTRGQADSTTVIFMD